MTASNINSDQAKASGSNSNLLDTDSESDQRSQPDNQDGRRSQGPAECYWVVLVLVMLVLAVAVGAIVYLTTGLRSESQPGDDSPHTETLLEVDPKEDVRCPEQALNLTTYNLSSLPDGSVLSVHCVSGVVNTRGQTSHTAICTLGTWVLTDSCSYFTSCAAMARHGYESRVYEIFPHGEKKMRVYCNHDVYGGGWTVFQSRVGGSVDFNRNWFNYSTGFGDPAGNFWLGLDNLHLLTRDRKQSLRVIMTDPLKGEATATYRTFWVSDERDLYRMNIGGYCCGKTPGDIVQYINNRQFSTRDRDNDGSGTRHCALIYNSGWWWRSCHRSSLNGVYNSTRFGQAIYWPPYTSYNRSLTSVQMMLKPL